MSDESDAPTQSNDSAGGGSSSLVVFGILILVLGGLAYAAYDYVFEEPKNAAGIDRSKPYVVVYDENNPPPDEGDTPGGGGGGGGDGGDGGGGGGGRMDPDARFAEADANGDGQLSGDEIQGRMQENLEEIDTDADGAISKEELTARIEAMRAQFGGGGGAEGRDRPEMESEETEEVVESEQE